MQGWGMVAEVGMKSERFQLSNIPESGILLTLPRSTRIAGLPGGKPPSHLQVLLQVGGREKTGNSWTLLPADYYYGLEMQLIQN